MTPDEATEFLRLAHTERLAKPLSRFLTRLDPRRVGAEGAGLFSNDPVMDALAGRQALAHSFHHCGMTVPGH